MKDGEGRDIDFKNTVIIMTSNAGTDLITKLCADPETAPDAAALAEALHAGAAEVLQAGVPGPRDAGAVFPAVAGRSSGRSSSCSSTGSGGGCRRSYGAEIRLGPGSLVETIAARCTETSSGARNVEKILSRTLLPELSAEVLSRLAEGATIGGVTVGVDTAGSFQYAIG